MVSVKAAALSKNCEMSTTSLVIFLNICQKLQMCSTLSCVIDAGFLGQCSVQLRLIPIEVWCETPRKWDQRPVRFHCRYKGRNSFMKYVFEMYV